MFTTGEFSRLAQVSKRLLRYYDQIGLLRPAHTDPLTGHRFYHAEQLPTLNRILALKDLGLSLDQIRRMLSDQVSTDEMQGMLLLRKAEIEQQLQSELQRIRNIEARLQSIRDAESHSALNVVVKRIPSQPVLSVRAEVESLEAGMAICEQVMNALPDSRPYGWLFAILYSDGIDDGPLDVEVGRILQVDSHAPVALRDGLQLRERVLPPVQTMATYVVEGWTESIVTGYSAIATWAEINGYRLAGAPREIALQLPTTMGGDDGVAEIQFPVEPIALSEHG
jgi:DNA-binding transcriptional MerR regulator